MGRNLVRSFEPAAPGLRSRTTSHARMKSGRGVPGLFLASFKMLFRKTSKVSMNAGSASRSRARVVPEGPGAVDLLASRRRSVERSIGARMASTMACGSMPRQGAGRVRAWLAILAQVLQQSSSRTVSPSSRRLEWQSVAMRLRADARRAASADAKSHAMEICSSGETPCIHECVGGECMLCTRFFRSR